ncbi:MAG: Hsp20/alpha crystallin family protein [Kiritimatiellae bacterium]|nr:Hsp20/alpha crystallin family protein [Kiritimatiellia bacterium]
MEEAKYETPAASFTENPEGYTLKVQLPGIAKGEAELHLDGKTLTLKTHSKYQNPAGFTQVAAEFARTNYALSAELPEMADAKALSANLENGVLTVSIGKKPETQARKIEIC